MQHELHDLIATVQSDPAFPADWVRCTELYYPKHQPRPQRVLFVNSNTGVGMKEHPPNAWSTVDVSQFVPLGTKAILASFFLIITHGIGQEDADLRVTFRRTGETVDNSAYYTQQAIEASVANGIRTNATEVVPLNDAYKFDVFWRPVPANWPAWSSYCINMGISACLA